MSDGELITSKLLATYVQGLWDEWGLQYVSGRAGQAKFYLYKIMKRVLRLF